MMLEPIDRFYVVQFPTMTEAVDAARKIAEYVRSRFWNGLKTEADRPVVMGPAPVTGGTTSEPATLFLSIGAASAGLQLSIPLVTWETIKGSQLPGGLHVWFGDAGLENRPARKTVAG